jgi:1,4-alpha-glucan branching enzyme
MSSDKRAEWNYKSELQWELLDFMSHGGMKYCVQKLNELYRSNPALHEKQFSSEGFEWIDLQHQTEAVMVYKRKGNKPKDDVLVILNMLPVVHNNWTIKISGKTKWKEIFNSDSKEFWGTGDVFNPSIKSKLVDKKNKTYEIAVHLPALGAIVLG